MAAESERDMLAPDEEKVNLKFVAKAIMSTTKHMAGWSIGDLALGIKYLRKARTKEHKEALERGELHFDPATAIKDKELLRMLQHTWELADGTYQKDDIALIRRTLIRRENIVTSNWKSQAFTPAYFIALDHTTKSVVFGVRGTASAWDALTDLAAKPLPFLSGHGHEGIVNGANILWKTMKPKLLEAVKQNKSKYPNLMFVGHSLGAGVSSLLTMLAKEDPDFAGIKMHCYAFAPPCVVSTDLAAKHRDLITSVVNEFDAVPRMTLTAVNALREDVANFDWKNAAMDSAAKNKLIAGAGSLKSKIGNSAAYQKTKVAGVAMKKMASSAIGGLLKSKKKEEPAAAPVPAAEAPAEVVAEAKEPIIQLVPPGTVYHLCIDKDDRRYLVPRDNDYFCTLELKTGMFGHHLLDQYMIGFRGHIKYLEN